MVFDKNGKTIFFSNNNCDFNSVENKLIIFNKVFKSDVLFSMFNENLDRLTANIKVSYPNTLTNYSDPLKILGSDLYAKGLEKYGLTFSDLRNTEDVLIEANSKCKSLYKNLKIKNTIF